MENGFLMMDTLKPSFRYGIRLYMLVTLVGIVLLGAGIVFAWLYSANWDRAVFVNSALQSYMFVILLGYLLSLLVANKYYRGLYYELHADGITLHRGIRVASEQRIYLRTVAGITVKRDVLDRWLEIGTLEFMLIDSQDSTPGIVKLVGISDVNEGYRKISNLWLHFWGEQLLRSNKAEDILPLMMEDPFCLVSQQPALDEFKRQVP